ncbi:hypothetical protein [Acuticoccus kandeliae]|uniref:hypothetical protein n=1 Tax=Acuticoccus kandeliae TaxID=2073160 RepID=UPI000D3EA665|nr:hypothetical protein [Acuticoccus kandeliae]
MVHLWLHVGSHKTGTTSIQATFDKSRRELLDLGLSYPENYLDIHYKIRHRIGHHYIAQALGRGELQPHIDAIRQNTSVGEVILSTERFDYVTRRRIRDLPDIFGGTFSDVTVLLYVREAVSLSTSRGQQMIKRGIGTYAGLSADPPLYDYKEAVEKWTHVFGRESIRVRPFSKGALLRGDVVDDILHCMGRDASSIGLNRKRRNDGISLQAALAISARKNEDPGFQPHVDGRDLFKIPGDVFRFPKETEDHIRQQSEPGMLWLRDEYGIDFSTD